MSQDDKTVIASAAHLQAESAVSEVFPSLVQYSGQPVGKRYELAQSEAVVGRATDVDIPLSEGSVSRRHARIFRLGDSVFIEDMGSANGVFVNDIRVSERTPLRDQDMVRLGNVMLKYFSPDNIDSIVHDKIYRMATIDAGTGIANKAFLSETLERVVERCRVGGNEASLIYVDLDHFKRVNDQFGHNAGDQVLRSFAELIQEIVRDGDVFARFGGEEFIIVMPDTPLATARNFAETVRQRCENHVFRLNLGQAGVSQTYDHHQTVSAGIACWDPSMAGPNELLEAADRNLYQSKHGGRNRVTG